ncbi:MAG TPA: LptF/LptG family permease [Candidatus Brocadiia bacterium]|nr:LptF/LptG family permease [Candidatus Brocadiia bacterium]
MAFTLERYVLRQTLASFAVGLFAMTSMIFLGMGAAMMRDGYNIIQIRGVWHYLLLYATPYATPTALLCAVTLVFGRMSGDNEIIAARSSGAPPERLVAPVLLLGALASAGSFVLNQWTLPEATSRVDSFKERIFQTMLKDLGGEAKDYNIGSYRISVAGRGSRAGEWEDVVVFDAPYSVVKRVMRARRGRCLVFEDALKARIELFDCMVLEPESTAGGLEALDQWLKSGGAPRGGLSVAGPSNLSLDVDLSTQKRRASGRPSGMVLPRLIREIAALRARVAALPDVPHPQSARREKEKEREAVSRQRSRLDGEMEAPKAERDEASQGVQASTRALRAASQRIERLAAELDGVRRRVADVDAERKELEQDIRAEGAIARLAALATSRASLAAEEEGLKRQAAAAQEELRQAQADVDRHQKQLARLQGVLDEMESRRNAMLTEEKRLTREFEAAREHERLVSAVAEFHTRNAGAAACLAFVMLGAPLGILSHRGSVIFALAYSFGVILLIYYPLVVVAQALVSERYLPAAAGFWTPVAVVGGLGLFLQTRVVRR